MRWAFLLRVGDLTVNLRWRTTIKALLLCFCFCLVRLGNFFHEYIHHFSSFPLLETYQKQLFTNIVLLCLWVAGTFTSTILIYCTHIHCDKMECHASHSKIPKLKFYVVRQDQMCITMITVCHRPPDFATTEARKNRLSMHQGEFCARPFRNHANLKRSTITVRLIRTFRNEGLTPTVRMKSTEVKANSKCHA